MGERNNGYKAFGDFIKSFVQRNSSLVGHVLFIEDSKTARAGWRGISDLDEVELHQGGERRSQICRLQRGRGRPGRVHGPERP